MPCKVCEYVFTYSPCSTELKKYLDNNFINVGVNVFHRQHWAGIFNNLKKNCPCSMCVVKMVCSNYCKKYEVFSKRNLEC